MKPLSATHARNRFATVISQLGDSPVPVERHGKTVAFLVPAHRPPRDERLALQREARLQQQLAEQQRLVRHLQVAVELITLPRREAQARVRQARNEVRRWQREGLCSKDYIVRWESLLALPPRKLAARLGGDLNGWGPALRQNSPLA